jgi:hypothetical protein
MLQVLVAIELKIRWYFSKLSPQNTLRFASFKAYKIGCFQIVVNHFDESHKLKRMKLLKI